MGESTNANAVLRAIGVVAIGLAGLAGLSSCALFGAAPAPSAPAASASASASGDVVDPSVPSDDPSPEPTEASPTPSAIPTSAAPSASASPVDARKKVVPFITSAEWDPKAKELDVSGIVPSVREKGGSCTITATSGGTWRTVNADAVAASSYTGCETVSLKDLAAGDWSIRIRYSSDTSVGTSATRTVTVA